MAVKQLGRGTKIYMGLSTDSTYTLIPNIATIGEIRKTSPKVDVTTLEDAAHTYLGGLPDPGTINATGLWDPLDATHQALDTAQRGATVLWWKIEIFRIGNLVTPARTGKFVGYVAEFGTGPFENTSPMNMNIVWQMSGDITWS